MPLLELTQINAQCQLAIWDINESETELQQQLKTKGIHFGDISSGNTNHRSQKLSVRLLLSELLNKPVYFSYDVHGKPILPDLEQKHISISHSYDKAVVILSNSNEVGIDIEIIKEKIHKIKHKFLKEEELTANNTSESTEALYVAWCAKEALYKRFGQKGVSLKNDIQIYPFVYNEQGGVLKADILPAYLYNISVYYRKQDQYMLAYVCE